MNKRVVFNSIVLFILFVAAWTSGNVHAQTSAVPTVTAAVTTELSQTINTGKRHPTWSSMQQIAYYKSMIDGTGAGVWVINADGSNFPAQLLSDSNAINFKWAPDGSKLAFATLNASTDGSFVIKVTDGKSILALSHPANGDWGDTSPVWSPDGKKIAFTCDRGGDQHDTWVCVVPSDGSTQEQTLVEGQNPSWSPDGENVVLQKDNKIFTVNISDPMSIKVLSGDAAFPVWSPDGKWISYTDSALQLWAIKPDGAQKTRIIPIGAHITATETEISWSPDGKYLVFTGESGGYTDEMYNIYRAAVGGDFKLIQLTVGGISTDPTYSPDGKQIAYTKTTITSFNNDTIVNGEIYTMDSAVFSNSCLTCGK